MTDSNWSRAQSRSSWLIISGGASLIVRAVRVLGEHARSAQPLADLAPGQRRRTRRRPTGRGRALRGRCCAGSAASRSCRCAPSLAERSWNSPVSSIAMTSRADRAGQRVAAERRAVLARLEHAEDVGGGHHGGHRHDAAAERLAQDVHVGHDILVLARERGAGPAEARTGSRRRSSARRARCRARAPAAGTRAAARSPRPRPGSARPARRRPGRPWRRPARRRRRRARSGSRACTGRRSRARPGRWRS